MTKVNQNSKYHHYEENYENIHSWIQLTQANQNSLNHHYKENYENMFTRKTMKICTLKYKRHKQIKTRKIIITRETVKIYKLEHNWHKQIKTKKVIIAKENYENISLYNWHKQIIIFWNNLDWRLKDFSNGSKGYALVPIIKRVWWSTHMDCPGLLSFVQNRGTTESCKVRNRKL